MTDTNIDELLSVRVPAGWLARLDERARLGFPPQTRSDYVRGLIVRELQFTGVSPASDSSGGDRWGTEGGVHCLSPPSISTSQAPRDATALLEWVGAHFRPQRVNTDEHAESLVTIIESALAMTMGSGFDPTDTTAGNVLAYTLRQVAAAYLDLTETRDHEALQRGV